MASAGDAPLVIGIDVGTQSLRAIAFDAGGHRVADALRPTPAEMEPDGNGIYDPNALFDTVIDALIELGRKLAGRPVAGLAVASIGESCVLADADGRPLAPSLVWFDRRPAAMADRVAAAIGPERVFAITGLAADPTLTLCKLLWMRQHWPDAVAGARRLSGIADWIAQRLSGATAMDPSAASRTLMLDVHRRTWSPEMMAVAELNPETLPPICPAGTPLGSLLPAHRACTGLAGDLVVGVGAHDHLAGSFAAGIVRPGMMLDSMGTAEALLLATAAPLRDPAVGRCGFVQGVIETDTRLAYLGGGINSSGGAMEWLRGLFGGVPRKELIAEAAAVPPGSRGVLFVPHLVYAPPPAPDFGARGAFLGLTPGTTRGALYRAVLEGLALQTREMIEAMAALPGVARPEVIRAIGGNVRNPLFLAIKASTLGRPIDVVDEPEATALGAALLGGLAAGLWPTLAAALAGLGRPVRRIEPDAEAGAYYAELGDTVFRAAQPALKPLNRSIAALEERGLMQA